MQGTLNEIDIRSILQLIELGQRTGELFVESYPLGLSGQLLDGNSSYLKGAGMSNPFWFVFFVNGQIAYAADQSHNNLSRLRDYLHRYKAEAETNNLPISTISLINAPEYASIWLLLEKNILKPEQGRRILESMVQETLFDLLSLHQGEFVFEMGPALAPQLTTLEVGPLVTKIMKQVQQWKELYPHIYHPHQYIVITNEPQLKAALSQGGYHSLSRWANNKTTLRQLSRYLNRELLAIAKALYPYAERGWLQFANPVTSQNSHLKSNLGRGLGSCTQVLCVDDDLAIGKQIEYILQEQGYQVTLIQDPLEALSRVFILKPDIILCDIAMPTLDGYEVCAMLRQSTAFRQVPIIMLTGRETFIDRLRARLVGATDYLTKPFGANELLLLLEKYTYSEMERKSLIK